MTPMQSLKPQFDKFKSILPEVFKEVSLNKSKDRTYVSTFCGDRQVHEMKGVKSDFIKTFKAKLSDENSYSIGFSFKYLGVAENEYTVQVSLKVGNKVPLYYKAEHLSVDDFRSKFNDILEQLQGQEDHKKIATFVQDGFSMKASHHPKVHGKRKLKV